MDYRVRVPSTTSRWTKIYRVCTYCAAVELDGYWYHVIKQPKYVSHGICPKCQELHVEAEFAAKVNISHSEQPSCIYKDD